MLWWIVFLDPTNPPGDRECGSIIIRAGSFSAAVEATKDFPFDWDEVAIKARKVPESVKIPDGLIEKPLTREENTLVETMVGIEDERAAS